jgi:hypothetical protein
MTASLKYDPWEDDSPVKGPDPNRTEKEADHALENLSYDEMFSKLADRWWRLNNLYYFIDRDGKRSIFKPNPDQARFYDEMWYQNIILKSRQLGFTTFIDIFFLDAALFVNNTEAGIIAHTREDVSKIFRRKILYPYENLPDLIKDFRKTKSKSKTEIEFENNSIISVGTSMRSGTMTLLHISEFGKVCAHHPEKAREILTGSLPAIHTQNGESIWVIEATAEGKSGYFFDMCQAAQARMKTGRKPTRTEPKFHFFPWWDNNYNESTEAVPISTPMLDYFAEIEGKISKKLSDPKRWWYVSQWNIYGEDMKRENPSTPDEAFEQAIKGAYFSQQLAQARRDHRICSVPYQPGIGVRTWWDLGMNDVMAIWFTQDVGRELHVIDYYENTGEGFPFYATVLKEMGYHYTTHNAPHDIAVRELGTGKSRWEQANEIGLYFKRIPRIKSKIDSINAARQLFPICWFDEVKCSQGIERLEGYRKEWNEHLQTYRTTPLHDENSNGADAFQTLAMGHQFRVGQGAAVTVQKQSADGWT